MSDIAQLRKPDGCVDEIAKDDLAGFHIAGEKVFNPLAKKRLTKTIIGSR
jgi:hypothetical protein